MKLTPGSRTFVFGVVSLAFLLVGLALCLGFPSPGRELFAAFALAVGGITATIAAKHGVESLATGQGIAGAAKTLWTDKKPPEAQP